MKRLKEKSKLNVIKLILVAFLMTACSYGDDISSLRERVTNLEDAVSSLQAAYSEGKTITSVKAIYEGNGGYLVAFSDGTSLSLMHGSDGKDGLNGKDSADGKDGLDGKDGADGKDGLDGKDGADGKDGLDGKDGADGKDGLDGKDGADGKDGLDGKDGADGKDGLDGKDGADGTTPMLRIDEDGFWIVSYDNGYSYSRISDNSGNPVSAIGTKGGYGDKGDTGEKGDKGDTGEKGDKGDTGEKGDKGDTGEKGDKGDTGEKGDKGDTGEKGDKGDTGEKGDKGDTGEKGDKGDTGEKGDRGDAGISVRVAVIDGTYVFQLYSPDDPTTVIESIYTPYQANPDRVLQSIVEDQDNGVITLTMADGTSFRFNLDVSYPTGIILLTDHLDIIGKDRTASFEFRINPSNSFINFVYDGDNANIELDRISVTRADDADSYVTAPTNYRIIDVSPSLNSKGERKVGQYTVTVSSDAQDAEGEEIVALVITTKDGRGKRIQISSTLMTVTYDTRPQIYGIRVGGIDATRTDKDTFYVKLPYGTDTRTLAATFSTNSEITVDGESGPESIDLSNPVKLTATLNGIKRDYTLVAYYSNLPVVYVNTPSPVTSKDDWVKKSTILIANAGEYNAVFESAQLKGRGNSTWGYPKKPYAIKLDKKSEVLGMPKHKRWCLLANWMDRTNIRNDVSFEIGRRLSGLAWTPRGKFVDMVFNGKFVGNYYLCEQIKIDPNRVDIDEMTDSDVSGDALTGGYLLELDSYFDEVNKFRSAQLNLPVNFKDPDEDVLQTAQFDYMRDYFNEVEQKLVNRAEYSEIESLIDIDSFIDWWILYELAGNWEPNHPKSSYMYKKRNGKLYAGPAWDFDWGTFSGSTEWILKGAIWYSYLFQYPEFISRVKEKWQENRASLAVIPDYILTVSSDIKESSTYDCQIWPISQNVNADEQLSFQESVARLKHNYIKRFNWIDENISRLTAE